MKPNLRPGNLRAFTLTELLIVIAILAVAAAILCPAFVAAQQGPTMGNCAANLEKIGRAALMYAGDNNDTLPKLDNNGSCYYGEKPCAEPDWGNSKGGPPIFFMNMLQPYLHNYSILYCPSRPRPNWRAVSQSNLGIINGYSNRLYDLYTGAFCQYGVNIMMMEFYPNHEVTGHKFTIVPMSSYVAPSNLCMLADSVWDLGQGMQMGVGNTGIWPASSSSNNCYHVSGSIGWTYYLHSTSSDGANRNLNIPAIHSGYANVAMADGHVQAFLYPDLESCDYNTQYGVWAWTHWDWRY